ncbi:MAG: lactonase family protein [Capsulimonadaceae bacterium]
MTGHLWPVVSPPNYEQGDEYPSFLVTAPGGHVIYTGGRETNEPERPGHVCRYQVTASGGLDPTGASAAGETPVDVVFGRGGRFVYVYADTSLLTYTVSSNGRLWPLKRPGPYIGTNAIISADPLGRFVWVSRPSLRRIVVFRITQSGALEHVTDIGLSNTPSAIFWLPDATTAYAAIPDTGVISVFRVDHAGRPSLVQAAKVAPQGASLGIFAIHPDGRFMYSYYATERSVIIDDIAIKPDGKIAVSKIIPKVMDPSFAMAIAPDGRFAYTLGSTPCVITEFRIEHDGTLTRRSTRVPSDRMLLIAIASN